MTPDRNEPKRILITGASSGMGKAMAFHLHEKGYRVYGTSRRDPEKFSDWPFGMLRLDLEDPLSVKKLGDEYRLVESRLDVLINNAGRGMIGPVAGIDESTYRDLFQTNVFGPMELIRQFLPQLMASKGLIINITSIAGFAGLPYRGAYSASKAALMMLTQALRLELHGTGVRVVDVAPGDFRTAIAGNRFYVENDPESPFFETYERVLKEIDNEVDKGLEPEVMAQVIEKILNTPNPKPQYRVGPFVQRIFPTLKALIPQRTMEKIFLKKYGLK